MKNNITIIFLLMTLLLSLFLMSCTKKSGISQEQPVKKDTTVKSINGKDTTVKSLNSKDSVIAGKLSYEQEQGSFLFRKYCAVCHGETGKGNGFNSFNLNPKPRNFSDSVFGASLNVDRLKIAISQGGRGVGKSQLMPPYGGTIKNNEIEYLAQYVLFLSTQKK